MKTVQELAGEVSIRYYNGSPRQKGLSDIIADTFAPMEEELERRRAHAEKLCDTCGVKTSIGTAERLECLADMVAVKTNRIAELETQLAEATDALETLYDLQNGSPLEKYEKDWAAAMEVARKILEAKAGAT